MIISFTGHAFVPFADTVKKSVLEEIRSLTAGEERVLFYLGGYGDFDGIAASACREIKKERCGVELIYVTPYISPSEQVHISDALALGLYDSALYPPLERVPERLAILKRNEWMMANADAVIAYVKHNYGGAYKALAVAKRKKKKIINICDLTE